MHLIAAAHCWTNPPLARELGLNESALAALLHAVATGEASVEHTYKEDRRSRVQCRRYEGRSWVVKTYRGSPLRMWCKHRMRQSTAWREWTAAKWLRAAGIRVIQPIALVHRGPPWRCEQALLMPHVEAPNLAQYLRNAPPEEWHGAGGWHGQAESAELARADPAVAHPNPLIHHRRQRALVAAALGRQIGRLTAAGLINRDHKASNLLIDARCLAGEQPILIDPAGLRRRPWWGGQGGRRVWRMLALLRKTAREAGPVSPREQLRCLRAALQADPTLAVKVEGRRIEYAVREISAAANGAASPDPDGSPTRHRA